MIVIARKPVTTGVKSKFRQWNSINMKEIKYTFTGNTSTVIHLCSSYFFRAYTAFTPSERAIANVLSVLPPSAITILLYQAKWLDHEAIIVESCELYLSAHYTLQ